MNRPATATRAAARIAASTARAALLAALAIFAAAGCESTPRRSAPQPAAADAADAARRALERAWAAETPAARAQHYLDALEALHGQGDAQGAARVAAALDAAQDDGAKLEDALSAGDRFRFRAIAFEAALAQRRPDDAARQLAAMRPATARQQLAAAHYRARALEHGGDPRHAAAAWSELAQRIAANGGDASAATAGAWRALSRLPILELVDFADRAADPALRAWAELARDFNAAIAGTAQTRIWRRWRQAYGSHAAARFPPPGLAAPAAPLRNIALLAPLTGRLAAAGETVRDGFVAAFLHARERGQTVRIYDTGALSIADAYNRARAGGAQVIVGPLDRDAVRELAALHRREAQAAAPSVVALNQFDAQHPAGIVQLALAVEADASALARAISDDGIERIVMLHSPAPWLARARGRFDAETEGIARVAEDSLETVPETTAVVGETLGIAASAARHRALADTLRGDIAFAPRRRDDIDAIVALVGERQLHALAPALEFHSAAGLPIYAPASAVRGALARLEGVRVCDIPWRLHPSPLRSAANAAFPSSRDASAGLFALGVDGFRVANQLRRLTAFGESLAGSTGVLTLDANGRVRRELVRGIVRDGRLAPLQPRNAGG